MSESLKKTSDSLIFGEPPERITHGRSFLVRDLSTSLTLLIFGEGPEHFAHIAHFWRGTWVIRSHSSLKKSKWANRSGFFKLTKNVKKRTNKYDFSQQFLSKLLIFCKRFAQKNKRFAHLSWATWENCSQLLICHEQPERFAHSHSFVLSDLSKSLTVAHLIWAIWANSQPWCYLYFKKL